MTLSVAGCQISKPVHFSKTDLPGTFVRMRIGKVSIANTGSAAGVARGCVATLVSVSGISPSDPAAVNPVGDAPLKWAGVKDTSRAIFPGQTVELGVFEIRDDGVYLHDQSDVEPPKPLFTLPGEYVFSLLVSAEDGQLLPVTVTLHYNDHVLTAS